MKFFKQSMLISLMGGILCCCVPFSAKAADTDFTYALHDDGTAEITCINTAITRAEIPSEVNGHVITALGENCFKGCTALTEIVFPDTVTTFGDYAFYGCSALTEITIPASVTEIRNYVFDTTERLTAFSVDENNPAYQSSDGVLYTKSGDTLIKYPEAKPDAEYHVLDSCRTLSDWSFIGAQYLEHVNLNQVQDMGEDTFYYCVSLKDIAIPEGVTDLTGAVFGFCTNLEQVSFPSTLEAIGERCFYACTSLKSVILPDSVKKLGAYKFCDCTALQSITVPKTLETVNIYCMGYQYDEDSETYQVQENCTLYVWRDSPAWKYAVTNHLTYELRKDNTKLYYFLIGGISIIIVILIIAIIKVLKNREEKS